MTISSTTRKAGPFVGNGVTTVFPFAFKVFANTDIVVTKAEIATGIETTLVLNADYIVGLNADQEHTPGGTVFYNPSGTPMASTHELVITSNVPQLQTLDLTSGGGFFPENIMAALDRAVILIQQLAEKVSRTLQTGITDTVIGLLPSRAARINKFLGFDSSGDPIAVDVPTGEQGPPGPPGPPGASGDGTGDMLKADNLAGLADYAVARTNLNVPTRTGGNASGSWAIDITGRAAVATNADHATNADNATNAGHATNADNATNAGHASTADAATNAGHATTADSAAFATTAANGGVTSVNGLTGDVSGIGGVPNVNGIASAVTIVGTTDADLGTTGIVVNTVGSTITIQRSQIGGGSSLHGDSSIEMADASFKWLRDVRLGDIVRGRSGPAEVLGIWANELGIRSLFDVNGVACTPGHLFPVEGGGWGAPDPEGYRKNSHDKRRMVKGKHGLVETHNTMANPNDVATLHAGVKILAADGTFKTLTAVREFKPSDGKVASNTQVIALLLDGSDIFYADGYAVATLA